MSAVTPPPDFGGVVEQLAQRFLAVMSKVLSVVDTAVVDLARMAYITILLLGLLLYFTRVEKRLGKDLIKGGVVLAVLSELVFPAVVKL